MQHLQPLLSPCLSPPAPCPPQPFQVLMDCEANVARIEWQNHQPTGNYTALLEHQSGHRLNCTSNTVNSCQVSALPCGRIYNITVTYDDGSCPVTSTAMSMKSGVYDHLLPWFLLLS